MTKERPKSLHVFANEKLGGNILDNYQASPHPEASYYFVRSNAETDRVERLACSAKGKIFQWFSDGQGGGQWLEVSNFSQFKPNQPS